MKCLRSLEGCGRGFESHRRHGCLCVRLFCVCVALCVGSGLATGLSPVQGVLPTVLKDYGTEVETRAQQSAVDPLMNT
jgi:hypothetical protein